jgi:formate-dependent nitrite reductase complex subunit NrfF
VKFLVGLDSDRRRLLGKDSEDLIERTVVRCAEGHVFSTASFPMQQAERLGPGRLVRCPRCARLRSVVPVALEQQQRSTTSKQASKFVK